MPGSATARAQAAHDELEQVVSALKRAQRAVKEALQLTRQTQAVLLGIDVETTEPKEGTVGNENEDHIRRQVDAIVDRELARHGVGRDAGADR